MRVLCYVLQRDNFLARDTRFFSTLYLQSILIQLLSYIHIHICMYVCIYNDTYTGIVVAKRTDQLITRGKLNLNVCHNVRGRKGFTLPSRDIFFWKR